jgi:methionyl-tRNA formyltransferase
MHRIALLVDRLEVTHQVYDLFRWASEQPDIELCGLVIQSTPAAPPGRVARLRQTARKQGWYAAASSAAFALVAKLEAKLLQRRPFIRERIGLREIDHPVKIVTHPQVSACGFIYRFSEEDLAAVRALEADLLIRCGGGILQGGILSAARRGVLSMQHGDDRVNRGGPPGFWEVLERSPYTGFAVQRLTEGLDGGEVLFRGRVVTQPLQVINRVNLCERSNVYLKKTIRDVLAGTAKPEEPQLCDRPPYPLPLLHDTARYAAKSAGLVLGRLARQLRGTHRRWAVAYTFGDWRSAVLWRAKTIPNPPRRFLADPFALLHEGKHYIFVEDYCYQKEKGMISAYRITEAGAERLGVVLEEDFHLSFPFVFRWGSEVYMIPETMASRQIRLYRCADFPMRWELHSVLVRDVAAVDSMVFERDGRWWMVTTINPTEFGWNDAELHLYSAASPFGPWQASPQNPVVMDAARGRSGGLLRCGETIYRVAQRHAFDEYGKGCSIYRIESLVPFRETHVQDIDPNFFRGLKGTHHLHHDGGLVTFDFARMQAPT